MALPENQDKFLELADQLEAEDPIKYAEVIKNLRDLEYDDFANQKFDAPKMQMIYDFGALGRQDVIECVKNGDFDQ